MSQAELHGPCVKSNARKSRGGFTLLEVLVATAVTLLMMVSLAQVFKLIGDSMKQGRAALELNSRLRNVAYRLQLDLNNCTITPKPGSDGLAGLGYFKIYDGPLTDYSYGMEVGDSSLTPQQRLGSTTSANRFGDCDDILMFTARAGDDWFVGKVPLFVLQGAAPDANNLEMVTITSQHAEIVVFAQPLVNNDANNPDRNAAYLRMNPSENYAKLLNPATGASTDLPASYRLHYRVLLIRPDLNLATTGALPNGSGAFVRFLNATQSTATFNSLPSVALPSPTCDMAGPHQQCDLSIRRVSPFAATSTVAANSLEDLANPANRFAHVQIPMVPGSGPGNTDYSMPILALSPKLDSTYTSADPGVLLTAASTDPLAHQSGFLHPAFTLFADRTGEDILASDVLAFDVKGFDPDVPLYDVSGTVVSPNDPGYSVSGSPVGYGDFVDIGWGRKVRIHQGVAAIGVGQLNGLAANSQIPFTDSMYKSGLAVQSDVLPNPPAYSVNLRIYQPSYDTWYSKYEGDGIPEVEIVPGAPAVRGALYLRGTSNPKDTWRGSSGSYVPDAGTDGIDNNSTSGVDDLSEAETSAPFPMDLRGVKVTVRIEDPAARTFNQMTVTKEFVTQ